MKRGILLILMVILLIDLADYECFGKVPYVPHFFDTKTALKSFHHYSPGKIDFSAILPAPHWREMPNRGQSQPMMHSSQLALELMNICNHGSSGGIPR